MKYRSVIALKWIVLATSFLLFSQQDALICSLQYVATHLFTVSLGSCYLVHRFIHLLLQCFLLPLGGLDTLLGSGFALLCLVFIQALILIIYCIQCKPVLASAAQVQMCLYGGTRLLLSPSWAVRVGQGVGDWCISQSGGLFRWVASCTNNDTWWKPLSPRHDRKWRWIVSRMGSDFVEQQVKNVCVVIILHNNCLQCSILKYWGHQFSNICKVNYVFSLIFFRRFIVFNRKCDYFCF